MNKISKALIAALVFGGSISTATAAGVITKIEATDTAGGTLDLSTIGTNHNIDLTKTFTSFNPITLTFTVDHQEGPGTPYSILENVVNNTGQTWADFHYSITEPNQASGVVFTNHTSSTLSGFTLDASSGPRNLDFTGSLANGQTANAAFSISPFDPGSTVGQTTFTLTQIPSPIPEPETYAMMLAGLLLMGGIAKRRSKKIQG